MVSLVYGRKTLGAPLQDRRAQLRELLWQFLFGDASMMSVALLAAVPVLAAIWALLSPDKLVSREMTWDLLFNLAGGWHVYNGHIPHIDFHEPVGALNFLLTAMGFFLLGPVPQAFLVGAATVALALFVAASLAAWRRLPLLPAFFFVVFVCLLTLMPANLGDHPNAYSFAMSYNRYGWAALVVVCFMLFAPPRNDARGEVGELAIVGLLLLALFYIKVTYFLAGLAALALAIGFCRHIRIRWQWWTVVGIVLVVQAIVPDNAAYIGDLTAAATAGAIRDNLILNVNYFLDNTTENATYLATIAIAAYLWLLGHGPARLPVAAAFLVVIGLLLVSQNSQSHGMPLSIVTVFLIYDALRQRYMTGQIRPVVPLLVALMMFPLLAIGASSASVVGYHLKAEHDESLRIVDHTNLRSLAVPTGDGGLLAAYTGAGTKYTLLNRARAVRARYELSPREYVQTILEAAALLAEPQYRQGGIAVLDQVNPLPFMLGLPPPRGGNLWSGDGAPLLPPEQVFADVEHVLIPKYSTYGTWTEAAAAAYGPYLAEHFRHLKETPSWILVSRERAVVDEVSALQSDGLAEDGDQR